MAPLIAFDMAFLLGPRTTRALQVILFSVAVGAVASIVWTLAGAPKTEPATATEGDSATLILPPTLAAASPAPAARPPDAQRRHNDFTRNASAHGWGRSSWDGSSPADPGGRGAHPFLSMSSTTRGGQLVTFRPLPDAEYSFGGLGLGDRVRAANELLNHRKNCDADDLQACSIAGYSCVDKGLATGVTRPPSSLPDNPLRTEAAFALREACESNRALSRTVMRTSSGVSSERVGTRSRVS